jgi:class 3 adenylate cyclase
MAEKTLTVVFTDIKGFTERTSKSSRADMLQMLKKHEELLKPVIVGHGGTVVKTIGDAFLLTFESPTNAVLCGLRMQARLKKYNNEAPPGERIEIRIAMNSGEVEIIGNDVFGDTVNLASRVEGVTEAGEIYFTEATYLVMNKSEVPTSQVGEFRFKGIPEPVRLFRVVQDENLELYKKVVASQVVPDEVTPEEADVPEGALSASLLYALEQQQALAARRRLDPIIWAVAMVVLLLLVGAGYWGFRSYQYRSQRSEAEQLVTAGQTREALHLLAALKEEKPEDVGLLEVVSRAVEQDIGKLLAEQRYDEALARLGEFGKTYPNLPILERLVRDARLAQVEHMYKSNIGKAHRELERLVKEYPKDLEIRFRFAYHNAETFGGGAALRRAMRYYREVAEADPGTFKDNEWVLKGIRKYLAAHHATDDTLKFIGGGYYDRLKPFLLEHIGDPDSKGAAVRRNAYVLLKEWGDLTPVDEFRFFTAELFFRTIVQRPFRDETFAYFEKLLRNGLPAEIKSKRPTELPEPRVLNRTSPDRKRALPIIKAFFPQALSRARK